MEAKCTALRVLFKHDNGYEVLHSYELLEKYVIQTHVNGYYKSSKDDNVFTTHA